MMPELLLNFNMPFGEFWCILATNINTLNQLELKWRPWFTLWTSVQSFTPGWKRTLVLDLGGQVELSLEKFILGSRNAYYGAFYGPSDWFEYLLLHCNTSRSCLLRLPSLAFQNDCSSIKGAGVPVEEGTENCPPCWWIRDKFNHCRHRNTESRRQTLTAFLQTVMSLGVMAPGHPSGPTTAFHKPFSSLPSDELRTNLVDYLFIGLFKLIAFHSSYAYYLHTYLFESDFILQKKRQRDRIRKKRIYGNNCDELEKS